MDETASTALKHVQIYEALKNDIVSGGLRYGERLYNEKWLCDSYGVSRTTLRKAVDLLIQDGYLERRPNRGTYVSYSKFDTTSDRPFSLFQEMKKAGVQPWSKILYYSLGKPSKEIAEVLHLEKDALVAEIHRLRFADSRPITINYLYIPNRLFPDFDPWLLSHRSLHEILKEDYHVRIAESTQNVDVTYATKEQSQLLDLPARTPLLATTSTVTSEAGDIIDFQRSWINTQAVPYSFKYNWA